jgi:hypothetical protein
VTSNTGGNPSVDGLAALDGLHTADLNGDHRPDLLFERSWSWRKSHVFILLNQGRGQFRRAGRYPTKADIGSLAVGDVDGDGMKDIVVSHPGGGPPGHPRLPALSVLRGSGDGHFARARDVWGPRVAGLALGDVNSDGKVDAVTTNGTVDVRLGDGHGGFGRVRSFGPRTTSSTSRSAI